MNRFATQNEAVLTAEARSADMQQGPLLIATLLNSRGARQELFIRIARSGYEQTEQWLKFILSVPDLLPAVAGEAAAYLGRNFFESLEFLGEENYTSRLDKEDQKALTKKPKVLMMNLREEDHRRRMESYHDSLLGELESTGKTFDTLYKNAQAQGIETTALDITKRAIKNALQ